MILGLTGGIASGKSMISSWCRSHHLMVIDGDEIAREVVQVGQPALDDIVAAFGSQILQTDGSLNRPLLAQLIFQSSEQKQRLDAIMQPRIFDKIEQEIHRHWQEEAVILDLPLLFEMHYDQIVDVTIVVAVDFATQMARLKKRNHLTEKEALQRIQSQMPLAEKVRRADFVIDNNGSREESYQQMAAILRQLKIRVE